MEPLLGTEGKTLLMPDSLETSRDQVPPPQLLCPGDVCVSVNEHSLLKGALKMHFVQKWLLSIELRPTMTSS